VPSPDTAPGIGPDAEPPELSASPVFADLDADRAALLAGCGRPVAFAANEMIFREGGRAEAFYVIRRGTVAIETVVPGRGALTIETVGPGGVVGWSWLFPPYRLQFDARAVTAVRATALDGACLRGKCAGDPALGYELLSRLARVLIERLQATRVRLLDVYGPAGPAALAGADR